MASKKIKQSVTNYSILLMVVLLSLLLLLSQFAGFFDPEPFWWIAFLGLGYPVILTLNVFSLFLLVWKKKILFLIPLIAIVVGFKILLSFFSFKTSEGSITHRKLEHDIRIMTYNVHSFKRYGATNEPWVRTKMLTILNEQQPDILCLQEFYSRKRGRYALTDSLKRILRTPHFLFERAIKNDYEAVGLSVFSKYPIVKHGYIKFEDENVNGCLWVDIRYEGKIIRIYNLHIASIGFKKEDYAYLNRFERKETTASSWRIFGRLKRAFQKRSRQVHVVKDFMRTCKFPFVVAGDFNDTPNSFAVRHIAQKLTNAFVKKGTGYGATYNGILFDLQIDYIFTSADFWIRNYAIVRQKLSDHYAVCSDVSLQ